MKKKTVILILALPFFLLSSIAYARKPAVLPVTGISIDNRPMVHPDKAQRFDFSNNPKNFKRVPASKTEKKFSLGHTFIIGLFISFPILMWIYMLVNLRRRKSRSDADLLILSDYRTSQQDQEKERFKKVS